MKKIIVLIMIICMAVTMLAGCKNAESPAAAESTNIESKSDTITVVDGLGKEVVLKRNPERVVSLYTSYLDLWDLAGGKVVGRVDSREDVPESAKAVDTVGHQILWNVRLPRTLIAGMVGMCLALSGAILQGIMRNPLAAPNIIGVSSGAGLMAFIILIIFPNYYYLAPAGAFIGALLATFLIYVLAWKNGAQPMRIILAGVAVSSLLGAGIDALMIFYPERLIGNVDFLVGGLSARTWPHFQMLWPYAALGIILTLLFPQKLNILMLGDEIAAGLGVDVERTRMMFIVFAALLAGSAVSVVGLLGFVGLIVPHTARLIIGSDCRYLFPASAILGSTVVILCDTIARLVLDPVEIPVGIIMALLGAPFFLYLLRERRSMGQ